MSTTSSSVVPKRPPSLPLTIRLSMSLLSNTTNLAKRTDGTVNRRLLSLIDPPTPPTTRGGVRSLDIVVDPACNLWLRLFLPWPTPSSLPLVVYFHGGGFVFLSPATKAYNSLCRRLARDIPAAITRVGPAEGVAEEVWGGAGEEGEDGKGGGVRENGAWVLRVPEGEGDQVGHGGD